jgi:hypothetical protein
MAAPEYTTDLQTVSLAETTTDWAEIPSRKGGGAPVQEDRAYIQGSYCVSQSTGAATTNTVGLQYDYGSNVSMNTGEGNVFTVWQYWQAPAAMTTWASGGMRFGVGSSTTAVNLWNAQGSDYGRNPYGGFANVAIDPDYYPDEQVGSPTSGEYRYFWSAPYLLSAVSKGNPHCVDAIRYGRAEFVIASGESSNSGTFENMAQRNDSGENRWGLFQEQAGTYLWKGKMSFGTTGAAVDFRDSNRVIVVDDTPRTNSDFNKIEINNASSRVDWTSVSFVSSGTNSRGEVEVVDNADVNWDGCSFTDIGTCSFQSNSTVINTIWQGCDVITSAGGTFTSSKVLQPNITGEAAFDWNVTVDPDGYLDNMTFSKGSYNHYGLGFGASSPDSVVLRGVTMSGFNASNYQMDSAIYINKATGEVTINVVDGTGTFSYDTAGCTANIVIDPVTTTIIVKDISQANIQNARVFLKAADGDGDLNFEESVSITQSGEVATVNHTAHELATNAWVHIEGCTQPEYNIAAQITKSGENYYTYGITGNPTSPATGSPTSTTVIFNHLTDASGEVTDTRSISVDQNITGRARKSSSSPYYKTQPIVGTIDASAGLTVNVLLISDE